MPAKPGDNLLGVRDTSTLEAYRDKIDPEGKGEDTVCDTRDLNEALETAPASVREELCATLDAAQDTIRQLRAEVERLKTAPGDEETERLLKLLDDIPEQWPEVHRSMYTRCTSTIRRLLAALHEAEKRKVPEGLEVIPCDGCCGGDGGSRTAPGTERCGICDGRGNIGWGRKCDTCGGKGVHLCYHCRGAGKILIRAGHTVEPEREEANAILDEAIAAARAARAKATEGTP